MNRNQKWLFIGALFALLACLVLNLHGFDMWGNDFFGVLQVKPLLIEWAMVAAWLVTGLLVFRKPRSESN